MAYEVLPTSRSPRRDIATVSNIKGINKRDFEMLLKDAVIDMRNYYKVGAGRIAKAPGLTQQFNITTGSDAGEPPVVIVEASSDLWYIGYAKSIARFVPSTGATTVIANQTLGGDVTDGLMYGQYFLFLTGIAGDDLSYVATTGAPTTVVEITNAGKGVYLKIVNGNRLAIANTDTSTSEIHVSRVDQLAGVPFSAAADWTVGTLPESPFKITYKNAGAATGIGIIGSQIVGFFERGKIGFRIEQVDVSGTGLVLDNPIDFQKLDFGADPGMVSTSSGIYYSNSEGIWRLASGGLTDTPFTANDKKISDLLSFKFFKNLVFTNSKIEEDESRELLLVTVRDNSSTNNKILVFNLKKGLESWSRWDKNVNAFLKISNAIYVADATATVVYKLDYDIGNDNNSTIATELLLEIKADANTLERLKNFSIGGRLSASSDLRITFDRLDRRWRKIQRVTLNKDGDTELTFTASGVGTRLPALGSGGIGSAAIGGRGVGDEDSLIDSRGEQKIVVADFLRLRVRITSNDNVPHEINLLSVITNIRHIDRSRNLTFN